MKKWLLGLGPDALKEIAATVGLKPFAAKQIAGWIYDKRAQNIGSMTNLSAAARATLEENYTTGCLEPIDIQCSADGTRKYLFPTLGRGAIEAVMIPDGDRATLCVSSQAGCRMGCRFCMTARQGFQYNLTAGEILNQFMVVDTDNHLTNIVFMGMGEPMDNLPEVLGAIEVLTSEWGLGWSPTRITVSTIGVLPAMRELLDKSRVHLAVSLHNPFDDERAEMMPMQKAYPIADVVAALRDYDFAHQRRLSFEYILFDGVNDTDRHADELLRLLDGLSCRINLIRFHAIPDSPLRGSSPERIYAFNGRLNRGGITTTTRSSRGEDILAACGMLSTEKGEKA